VPKPPRAVEAALAGDEALPLNARQNEISAGKAEGHSAVGELATRQASCNPPRAPGGPCFLGSSTVPRRSSMWSKQIALINGVIGMRPMIGRTQTARRSHVRETLA
jgi:hypothetical protein